MNKIRLAIADDHPLVLDGLRSLIDGASDIQLVVTAENGATLLHKLMHQDADVVLMDIDMPVKNGIETTRDIRQRYPQLKVLVLTMHDEPAMIRELVNDGAQGYLLKNCGRDELLLAIRTVREGKPYFSGEAAVKLLQWNEGPAIPEELKELTERELEVLKAIAEGKSNKEIGDMLFISHRTVDTHRTNLMKKLDVHNIAGLVRIAMRNGLIE
ncbi:MAG: DNA-binding response regulator [Cryomorphaceae bacterium]|nr:MAG: DNA-binding response regulator [Cryomorphaceae bacterium]